MNLVHALPLALSDGPPWFVLVVVILSVGVTVPFWIAAIRDYRSEQRRSSKRLSHKSGPQRRPSSVEHKRVADRSRPGS